MAAWWHRKVGLGYNRFYFHYLPGVHSSLPSWLRNLGRGFFCLLWDDDGHLLYPRHLRNFQLRPLPRGPAHNAQKRSHVDLRKVLVPPRRPSLFPLRLRALKPGHQFSVGWRAELQIDSVVESAENYSVFEGFAAFAGFEAEKAAF